MKSESNDVTVAVELSNPELERLWNLLSNEEIANPEADRASQWDPLEEKLGDAIAELRERDRLMAEIMLVCREIETEFQDLVPMGMALNPNVRCREPNRIPIAALRRLHGALTAFVAAAQEVENARARREADGDPRCPANPR